MGTKTCPKCYTLAHVGTLCRYHATTEAAHPTPWKVGEGYEQDDPGLYVTDAKGIVIASSDTFTPNRETADLIASAPKLQADLDQARTMLRIFVREYGKHDPEVDSTRDPIEKEVRETFRKWGVT